MKKRTLTILIAVVLVVACAVGGTLAWLKTQTQEVTNTFTAGDINITLVESDSDDEDTDSNNNSYKMVPGYTISKDPKVTVIKDSEKCYLFVKVDKTGVTYTVNDTSVTKSFDNYISYDMASGWNELTDANNQVVEGVYYRVVETSTTDDQEFSVIGYNSTIDNSVVFTPNKVLVKDTVTKEMLNGLSQNNYPTLTFTAYAVQYMKNNTEHFTPAEAWTNAQAAASN